MKFWVVGKGRAKFWKFLKNQLFRVGEMEKYPWEATPIPEEAPFTFQGFVSFTNIFLLKIFFTFFRIF